MLLLGSALTPKLLCGEVSHVAEQAKYCGKHEDDLDIKSVSLTGITNVDRECDIPITLGNCILVSSIVATDEVLPNSKLVTICVIRGAKHRVEIE